MWTEALTHKDSAYSGGKFAVAINLTKVDDVIDTSTAAEYISNVLTTRYSNTASWVLRTTLRQSKSVPIHILLEVGSIAVAAISIGSIAMWLSGYVPLLNPFASLLLLIASPYFFVMGRIARNGK